MTAFWYRLGTTVESNQYC